MKYIADDKELMKFWDTERNSILGKKPEELSCGSNEKVCWICEKNHHLIQTPHNKSKGRKCGYCDNQRLLPTYNDLKTVNPELADEWDYEMNAPFTPEMFYPSEATVVWWKCKKCNNSYEASINHRSNRKSECPVCGERVSKIVRYVNDLETTNPEIAKEWDVEKNLLFPYQVSKGSNEYAWWKCENGHSWRAMINSRTSKQGNSCPFCAGQKVWPGFNDLLSCNPDVASEWNYDRNDGLRPDMFVKSSTEVVWWKCSFCGNEWISSIDNRNRGRGCPKCSRYSGTSFPEQAIFYYVKKEYPDARNTYKTLFEKRGMELDVFIPSLNVGIEYDGPFHDGIKSFERDLTKYNICKENGIKLIRVRTNITVEAKDLCDVLIESKYNSYNYKELDGALEELISVIGRKTNIDSKRDRNYIRAQFLKKLKSGSLAEKFPEVAKEWDMEKNYPLTPDMFTYGSGESAFWKCSKCGYEWEAQIASRTTAGNGCKQCGLEGTARAQSKRVMNIDTGKEYSNLKESDKEEEISYDHISMVCRGKKKSVKGRRFRFID